MSTTQHCGWRRGASALACLLGAWSCLPLTAHAASDAEVLQALTQVYSTALISQGVADFCTAEAPSNAAQASRAHQVWRQRYEAAQAIQEFESTLPAAQLQSAQRTGKGVKDKLRQQGSAQQVCAEFISAWEGADMNMHLKYPLAYGQDGHLLSLPGIMARVQSGQHAKTQDAPQNTSPRQTSRQGVRPSGTVYSLAQADQLVRQWWKDASVNEARRRMHDAGRIYIRGKVVKSTRDYRLVQQDESFGARMVCIPSTNISRYEGQTITVGGVPRELPTYWLNLDQAEVVQDPSGLQASTLSEEGSMARLAVNTQRIRTAPELGVPLKDIVAVLYHGYSRPGVGVGMDFVDEVLVLLRDGTAYDRADVPLADLDVKASKALEPQRWSRWESTGPGKYRILKQDDRGRPHRQWVQAKGFVVPPWQANTRLNDTFELRQYTGSPLTGGIATRKQVSFKPDGRFETMGMVSIASGSVQADQGDSVSSSSRSDGQGTRTTTSANGSGGGVHGQSRRDNGDERRGSYRFDGYTAELHFDSGHIERLFSFAWDKKPSALYVLGESYSSASLNKR